MNTLHRSKRDIGLTFIFLFLFSIQGYTQALDTAFLYRILNMSQPEKSLALSYDGTTNRPILKTSNDQPTQVWKITRSKAGNFRIMNNRLGTEFSLDVVNDTAKNKLVLNNSNNLSGQAWRINANRDGTYRITCLWLGPTSSLDVLSDGTELTLSETASTLGQTWRFIKIPKPTTTAVVTQTPVAAAVVTNSFNPELYYRLTTQWLGDLKSLSTDGKSIKLATTDESALSQYWKWTPTENGTFQLRNEQFPGKVLDVINDGTNNQLTLTPFNSYAGQFWKLTANQAGNFYRINSIWQGDGKSLDVVNDNSKDKIILGPSGNFSGQFWKLKSYASLPQLVAQATPSSASNDGRKFKLMEGEELLPDQKIQSPNGRFTLIQQKDGNLVLYNQDNRPLWASGKNGKMIKNCIMQKDGNLVQYSKYNIAEWASNTNGNAGAYLELQDDGNLVIYSKNKQALWASNTQEQR